MDTRVRFRAGAAGTVISPPAGVDLCGYGTRPGPTTGTHDDLRAGALAVDDGTRRAVVVTADLVGLSADEVAAVRAGVQARTGVPAAAVLVACSHTHAGPATRCIHGLGEPDDAYLAELGRRLVDVAATAVDRLAPAAAGWARVPVSVSVNRRQRGDGRMVIGVAAAGLTAPYTDALYVDSPDGQPVARLFCHAAHGVTLGADNCQISGDWPGAAQRELERLSGGGVALFLQGCCGNLNSTPRGGFDVVEQQGRQVAAAVAEWAPRTPRHRDLRVGAASTAGALPLQPLPSRADAEAQARTLHEAAEHTAPDENRGVRMMKAGIARWADRIAELAAREPTARTVPFEVQAIRIGDFALVGLPGEVFVEYALQIAAASPFSLTAVAGYANGNIGYVPTTQAFAEGGYEVTDAIRFYGTTMPTPDCEGIILGLAADTLRRLAEPSA